MSIETIYGGTYITAAVAKSESLRGTVLTIDAIRIDMFKEKEKVVLTFKDTLKELPLNKTNAKMLSAAFGDDEKEWVGKQLEIQLTKRMFQGELVDGIEVVPK